MSTEPERHAILLIDDRDLSREALADLLRDENYLVKTAQNMEAARGILETSFNPTFIFADRQLGNVMIEDRALSDLKRLAPESLIVVFTCQTELSEREQYKIRAAGAVRILDKLKMEEQVKAIKALSKYPPAEPGAL